MNLQVKVSDAEVGGAVEVLSQVGTHKKRRDDRHGTFLTFEVADADKAKFASAARELNLDWKEV